MDPFVEIEIITSEVAKQGQKITPLVRDPIREKFYDMRSLAASNPDTWHDPKLFYRQGKFMEDFVDDYDKVAPVSMYSPTYQRLGYDQLRTYFTWRSKVRHGQFLPIPQSYQFLYIYELINGIGVSGPVDGLDRLMPLWDACRGHSAVLDESIAAWLKDYHVYYELPHSFAEFTQIRGLQDYYRKTFLFDFDPETTLENWAGTAGYDLTEFCTGEHRGLMRTGLFHAVVAMQKYFENRNECMIDFFYFGSPKVWWPFDDAVFNPTGSPTTRVVRISDCEVYRCENGRWDTRDLTPYAFTNNLIGYFIMVMESALRNLVGFKGKAIKGAARYKNTASVFPGMTVIGELTRLIESVAKKVYQDATRVVVTVDTHNLTRIREEAEVTQEKLIVDENATSDPSLRSGVAPSLRGGAEAIQKPQPCQFGLEAPPEHQPCHFGEVFDPESSCNGLQTRHTAVSTNETCPMGFNLKIADQVRNDISRNDIALSEATDPWTTFKNALSLLELKALKITLSNPDDIKTFANDNNIMLEILADGINEKAMDAIGDNILELADTMVIYEDYITEIEGLLR